MPAYAHADVYLGYAYTACTQYKICNFRQVNERVIYTGCHASKA